MDAAPNKDDECSQPLNNDDVIKVDAAPNMEEECLQPFNNDDVTKMDATPNMEEECLQPLNKINTAALEKQQQLWANESYIRYKNIETDKVLQECKHLEANIKALEEEEKRAIEDLERQEALCQRVVESYEIQSASMISVKQQEQAAEERLRSDAEKIKRVLDENMEDYRKYKMEYEKKHPVYRKLKATQVKVERASVENKIELQRLKELQDIMHLRKKIGNMFSNKSVVAFAKAAKEHEENRRTALEIRKYEDEERGLVETYEKKMKELHGRKKLVEVGFTSIPSLSTDLMFSTDAFPQRETPSTSVAPKLVLQSSVLSNYLSCKSKIQDYEARSAERMKQLQDLKNDKVRFSSNVKIIDVQTVLPKRKSQFATPQKLPHKLKKTKSIHFPDVLDALESIEKPSPLRKSIEQPAFVANMKTPSVSSQIHEQGFQQVKDAPPLASNRSQEWPRLTKPNLRFSQENVQKSAETSHVFSSGQTQELQTPFSFQTLASSSNTSQESSISQKMARWQAAVPGFDMYNISNEVITGQEHIENDEMNASGGEAAGGSMLNICMSSDPEQFLRQQLNDSQNYFNPNMLSPPQGLSKMNTFEHFDIINPTKTTAKAGEEPKPFGLFQFQEPPKDEQQPFQFKGPNPFNMF